MRLDGLSHIFLELTNRCDKNHLCPMCGRQKGIIEYGDMNWTILCQIARQVPPNIIVSFHRNGEPTAYPFLGQAIGLFRDNITSIVTHGLNLIEKADEIIGNCTTVVFSRFEFDADRDEQLRILKEFIEIKGGKSPQIIVKYIGEFNEERLPGVIYTSRSLHSAKDSKDYKAHDPVIPESGVCLDLISTLSIDWNGDVYICNRKNPAGLLGNVRDDTLPDLWNGPKRQEYIAVHKAGLRQNTELCKTCQYWGIPVSF